jgi:hypothetical protein
MVFPVVSSVGIMQARIGKRLMLNIGMGITALGLLIPYFYYSFSMVLLGFVFRNWEHYHSGFR